MTNSRFEIIAESPTGARAGILHTAHGPIETPVFMPVGTQATVKGLTPSIVKELGSEIILGNTYHLALRPGVDLIRDQGGLHKFMAWDRPILTDSGGYQVFSLSDRCKIDDNGVKFRSHIDGHEEEFTPKRVVDLQLGFGSDIMMPLDICTAYPSPKEKVAADMVYTHRWEAEAYEYWASQDTDSQLFAIVQGGLFEDLRQESIDTLSQYDFPGFAIGGLSVGEGTDLLNEWSPKIARLLPREKPRYLMGVGLPENMEPALNAGVDMFDCVAPTRLARHGQFFYGSEGREQIKNQKYKADSAPLKEDCSCYSCQHWSRAYIRHLFMAKEMLGAIALSIHNLHTLVHICKDFRQRIIDEN